MCLAGFGCGQQVIHTESECTSALLHSGSSKNPPQYHGRRSVNQQQFVEE